MQTIIILTEIKINITNGAVERSNKSDKNHISCVSSLSKF